MASHQFKSQSGTTSLITHGNLEIASKVSDVLSDADSYLGRDEEQTDASHSGYGW